MNNYFIEIFEYSDFNLFENAAAFMNCDLAQLLLRSSTLHSKKFEV